MMKYPELSPCFICGKLEGEMYAVADLGYLGDAGEYADLPPYWDIFIIAKNINLSISEFSLSPIKKLED